MASNSNQMDDKAETPDIPSIMDRDELAIDEAESPEPEVLNMRDLMGLQSRKAKTPDKEASDSESSVVLNLGDFAKTPGAQSIMDRDQFHIGWDEIPDPEELTAEYQMRLMKERRAEAIKERDEASGEAEKAKGPAPEGKSAKEATGIQEVSSPVTMDHAELAIGKGMNIVELDKAGIVQRRWLHLPNALVQVCPILPPKSRRHH